jgi:hypothetical protein
MSRAERRAAPKPARTPWATKGPHVAHGGRLPYPAIGGVS